MFLYGQTSANGIAVMSYLASDPDRWCGSGEIAKSRKLSRALTAKVLTRLSFAGLVRGQPGPGGGYALAMPPGEITLLRIVSLFEQISEPVVCPFGKDWCGKHAPCPLHDPLMRLRAQNLRFLETTTLDAFVAPVPSSGR